MRFHDFFAGLGGSSTGLTAAGMEGVIALNHWDYAIEIHNENHPDMDHDQADVWSLDIKRYNNRGVEVGWFSPDCTCHTPARGKSRIEDTYTCDLWGNPVNDPDADRSRMLMEAVPYISRQVGYKYVLVENVVEVVKWSGYARWIVEMTNLGYDYQRLCLNSRHFGTPQSRDRVFFVFWQHGVPAPDLEFRPAATCQKCGQVEARQAWKPGRTWGKYKAQYIYVCPNCAAEVEPDEIGADTVIDWTLDAPRIGDRKRPLADSTLRKIQYGIERYGHQAMVLGQRSRSNDVRPADVPLGAVTTFGMPSLLLSYYSRDDAARPADDPMPTVTTENRLALVMANYGSPVFRQTDEPLPTVTTNNKHNLIMAYYTPPVFKSPADPLPSVLTVNKYFLVTYNGKPVYAQPSEPMPTVTTVERHALVGPVNVDMDDLRFRMLEPRELASGTGFPTTYILRGPKSKQVRGIGGAVDPNVAQWLAGRVMAAANGE